MRRDCTRVRRRKQSFETRDKVRLSSLQHGTTDHPSFEKPVETGIFSSCLSPSERGESGQFVPKFASCECDSAKDALVTLANGNGGMLLLCDICMLL
ncbi:unnamed protein product [Protopolystoma xenopodis]|uniref:Uncharacterized protein n=1 Tax=Protopolystoma xenopodis TaxID=117903 RepID=A0A3S5BTH2_9PLAT|nr:unnamed protein product [Protopolystoma xenopodis]